MKKNINQISVFIEKNYDEMSRQAADLLIEKIQKHPEGTFGFATGSTPLGMYQELVRQSDSVDFSKITTFNLDEYYPIQKTNNQSYFHFMHDNLFSKINVSPQNIHIPNGETDDPEKSCKEYEDLLSKYGPVEMQILGIGLNGHIGFNEPSDTFSNRTFTVDLSQSTLDANARFFENPDLMPKKALTMSIRTILHARSILLLASGAAKAQILHRSLTGPITPVVPASALQLHPQVIVVVDQEAAEELLK